MSYWGEGNHQGDPPKRESPLTDDESWRHDPARKGLRRGKYQVILIPLTYLALFGVILLLAWLLA